MNNTQESKILWTLQSIREFLSHMSSTVLGKTLYITAEYDKKHKDPETGSRIYIRIYYHSPCVKTGDMEKWEGAKWYISQYMTEMELVMKIKDALLKAIEHEVLEGFKFGDTIIINPHVSFRKLLEISGHEEVRGSNFDF